MGRITFLVKRIIYVKRIETGLGSFFVNKIYLKQSNKFSISINKCHPSIKLEEKSKFSVPTPSNTDINSARLKSPKFEKNKINVNENIKRELQQLNFPKDSKVVDQIVEKNEE